MTTRSTVYEKVLPDHPKGRGFAYFGIDQPAPVLQPWIVIFKGSWLAAGSSTSGLGYWRRRSWLEQRCGCRVVIGRLEDQAGDPVEHRHPARDGDLSTLDWRPRPALCLMASPRSGTSGGRARRCRARSSRCKGRLLRRAWPHWTRSPTPSGVEATRTRRRPRTAAPQIRLGLFAEVATAGASRSAFPGVAKRRNSRSHPISKIQQTPSVQENRTVPFDMRNPVWGVHHHKRDTTSALRGSQQVGGGVCMLLISAGATHGYRA